MFKARLILIILLVNLYAKISGAQSLDTIDFRMVQELAEKIGEELWSVGQAITKRAEIQESFSQARVVNKSGVRLVDDITRDLKAMLDVRINAVKRIVKVAQDLPKVNENSTDFNNYTFINTRGRDQFRKEYLAEKKIRDELLEKASQDKNYTKKRKPKDESYNCIPSDNPPYDDSGEPDHGCMAKFNETLNIRSKEASVFVPLDIFDKGIQDGNMSMIIHRSRGLDRAFLENYRRDSTIGWQYFCNSSGLFRHFPATEWNFHPVNTYDCRMRHWFTGAAASSKDVMILVERSGSMLGSRIAIAIDVVRNILDTMTPNDYVNVLQFNQTSEYLISCAESLIQATTSNIFDLKQALNDIAPDGQGDLAEALEKAFETLEKHKRNSSNCNQVIMLITDGMEYNETIQAIFRKYKGNNFRVFSFLIGEQIPEHDYEQIKLMACENRGYYTQIDTIKETREQALKYIPVMSRPLSLSAHNPIAFSNVYVDIMDTFRTTNYDWNCKQREVQRDRVVKYLNEYDWYPCITKNSPEEPDPEYRKYVFMTTISMPAFERGENASLMGVAAVDVPLFEFERLFQNYRLGVGGYVFILDGNGIVLKHPDFRPFFQGKILKPSYNSVDMSEVELMDDGYDAREFSPYFTEFRKSIILKQNGSKYMQALQPYDDMRRAFSLRRNYFWNTIKDTPFTVVVSFPDHFTGRVQVPESEIDAMMTKGSNLAKYFKEDFKLHPDWIYCRGIRKGFEDIKLGLIDPDNCEMTPEEEIVFYLEKFEASGWKWNKDKLDSNETRCDRRLMQMLIYDAKATEKYPADFKKHSKEMSFIEKFRIRNTFVSTHSGLLRYKIFDKKERGEKFGDRMKKAIDEVWYKQTVQFNKEASNEESFVYSVPFNAHEKADPQITATHTIFIKDGTSPKIPIAVVGFQFAHAKLEAIMEQHCPRDKEEQCYVLDENAYIMSDPVPEHTGKFFGTVERRLMNILVEEKVFQKTKVYDYQAVCYGDRHTEYESIMLRSSALKAWLWNPFKYLVTVMMTFLTTVYAMPSYMANLMYPDSEHDFDPDSLKESYCPSQHYKNFTRCLEESEVLTNDTQNKKFMDCWKRKEKWFQKCNEEKGYAYILQRHLTRTRPTKCDKYNFIYSLTKDESNFLKPYDECSRPFVVHRIAHSNLLLLITNRNCAQVFATTVNFEEVPITIEYDNSTFCHKLSKPQLFRSRPRSCMTHHEREPTYDPKKQDRSQCGRGTKLKISLFLVISVFLMLLKTFISY